MNATANTGGREMGAETFPGAEPRTQLDRNLGWIILALLVVGCLAILRPFVSTLLWAIVLSYSSWPIYQRLLHVTGGRRTVAAVIMSGGLMVVLLAPFLIVGSTFAANVSELATVSRRLIAQGPPKPPAWMERLPIVGPRAKARWESIQAGTTRPWQEARRFVEPISSWALRAAVGLGAGLIHLALSILIALFLFRDGAVAEERLERMLGRVAGERGRHLLRVAGSTVRGVVYGVLGTSLVQAVLAGIGFLIAGVPGPGLLALLTFFASVVPVFGTTLVWLPAALWLFGQGATGWGFFMIIWGLAVGNVDNIVRPLLISQGSDMPFILILFGVLGGALAFGFIGIFLGPTLLAVGFRVLDEWSSVAELPSPRVEGLKFRHG